MRVNEKHSRGYQRKIQNVINISYRELKRGDNCLLQTSVRGTEEYGGKINYGDRVSQTKFKMLSIFPITSLK